MLERIMSNAHCRFLVTKQIDKTLPGIADLLLLLVFHFME